MKNFTKGWLALTLVALIGCAASTPPAVGVWGVEMNTPLGNIPATLTINEDGKELKNNNSFLHDNVD